MTGNLVRRARQICCLAALVLLAGCGGVKTANVNGKVTFKNQPVTGGTIVFRSADDPKINPASGVINPDGTFSVDKVPVGKVKVTIDNRNLKNDGAPPTTRGGPDLKRTMQPPPDMPEEAKKKMAERPGQQIGGTEKPVGTYMPIPDSYADVEKSGLSYDIHSGNNEITVELK
jgi:hypothetical protein